MYNVELTYTTVESTHSKDKVLITLKKLSGGQKYQFVCLKSELENYIGYITYTKTSEGLNPKIVKHIIKFLHGNGNEHTKVVA